MENSMIKAIKDDNDIIVDYGNHLTSWNCEVPEVPLIFGDKKLKYINGFAVPYEDIDELKTIAKTELRLKCREEREKYFPDSVLTNLLAGCLYSNEYMSVSNYKKLADVYRNIVHDTELLIDNASSRIDIDNVLSSVIFPTENDLKEKVK